MLCDNALLSRLYLRAFHATGKASYRRVAEETLEYVAREMTSPDGGFYSAQDADSEGDEDGNLFNQYFDVTEGGNFEGSNVLSVPRDADVVAHLAGISQEHLEDVISRGRERLFTLRGRSPHHQATRPGRWCPAVGQLHGGGRPLASGRLHW
jgi:uncharacterized protein YyaL (SSP411 family)